MTFTVQENAHFGGSTTVITNLDANASISNSDVASNAAIAATKLEHQFGVSAEMVESSTNVSNTTTLLHIVQGATGEIVEFEAAIMGAMTTDRTLTVDLQKSTGAAAFATVMSATISMDDTTVVRTATSGTLDSTKTDLVAGDILQAVLTLGGASGTLAQGLVVTATIREDAA